MSGIDSSKVLNEKEVDRDLHEFADPTCDKSKPQLGEERKISGTISLPLCHWQENCFFSLEWNKIKFQFLFGYLVVYRNSQPISKLIHTRERLSRFLREVTQI